jgi:aryl-alcohol dehydrogenase-like predicted oxidoreductase
LGAVGASNGELDMRSLGKSGLTVSSMGIGTRKWGDTSEGFGGGFDEEALSLVFEAAVGSGCTLFDTDEVYGYQSLGCGQQAEQQLGRLKQLWSHPARPPIVLGTKYCPLPWANRFVGGAVRVGNEGMAAALQASLHRLGQGSVDLWQIQNPVEASNAAFMEGLAEAVDGGLVRLPLPTSVLLLQPT